MLMKAVEARKKAEVVYVHINKLENTHSRIHTRTHTHTRTHGTLPKKSQSHYSADGFLLSLLSLHSSTPFILSKSKDSGPSSTFPSECAAA